MSEAMRTTVEAVTPEVIRARALEEAARICEQRARFQAYGHTVVDERLIEVAEEIRRCAEQAREVEG